MQEDRADALGNARNKGGPGSFFSLSVSFARHGSVRRKGEGKPKTIILMTFDDLEQRGGLLMTETHARVLTCFCFWRTYEGNSD